MYFPTLIKLPLFSGGTGFRKPATLITLAVLLEILHGTLIAQVKPNDTLYMNNGQFFIGELKQLKSGKVEFDIDDAALVKIKYDKIKTIKGLSHQYRIETSDRKIIYGQLLPGDKKGILHVQTPDTVYNIPLEQVSYLTFFNNTSFKTLDGYVSSGFNYTRSSNFGRFTFDGSLTMQAKRYKLDLKGSMFVTKTDSLWIRDRENLTTSGFYILDPWWQIGVFLNYQRNYELGLARRFQEGLGAKFMALNKNNFKITLLSGLVVNQEKNTEGENFDPQIEFPLQIVVEFFKFSKPNIKVNTSQTIYTSLTSWGRIRQDGDFRLSWEIVDDLSLSFQFYHNFDSRPPSGSNSNWDYGTVLGLKYEF
jgi:hypothetical protein